jgi:peptidyl-prolyl cis-trans isomerase SurA
MRKLFLGFLLVMSSIINAQDKPKEVLFTIDDKPYYTDEFERVYKKNLDLVKDESQKDLNHYLELFVGYKLKVTKANKLGLQNTNKFKNELKSYRTQLSKNYTSDSKVTAELVKEGYERMKKEIKASHILIMCDENASEEDTLKAFNKISDIRKRINNGEDFSKLAEELSEDPSAKENKGNLGYFSSFRMVYAFENAAFTTAVGQTSKPFRTRFGYHIVKVFDVRDNRGEISVAHIMTMNPKEGEDPLKPEQTINEVYTKLQQGEKFEELAKQFSEDKSSASKGGTLNRFSSGQLSSEAFENTAFGLTKDNPISKPFQSEYGWHIVKLIEKYPLKTLEESKKELENKISRDDRSRIITKNLTEKLRKKYTVKRDEKVYAAISKLVTNDYYEGKLEIADDVKSKLSNIAVLDKNPISGATFVDYIITQQKAGISLKPVNKLVDLLYSKFIDEQLNTYYNDNLEKEFPEFANIMEEYHDGLLLFDLMEKEIWERSKTDTLGLKAYHDSVKEKYKWKTRLNLFTVSSTNIDMVKKAQSMFKKGKTAQEIKDKLNVKGAVNIMITESTVEEGDASIPAGTKSEVGLSAITQKGEYYFLSNVVKVIPETYKTLDECKGKVINEYQQYLEQNWVNELQKESKVNIDYTVFEKIKSVIKP